MHFMSFRPFFICLSFAKAQRSRTEYGCLILFDPLGQPTVTASSDHCFRTCRLSVPTFQNKTNFKRKQCSLLASETAGLAEWIIKETSLILFLLILATRQ